ncbi:transferrin receptor protein 2 isoform X2 [Protopterus annectens]|uniref:transferrin receptor protein 2 isoform X2 n=1 Tax=Protopterus annectens TaxID=7888 RepID=UPI001CFA1B2C|nr:transferrin receptor protein 2 isoform X2 [Protopterus annectens]
MDSLKSILTEGKSDKQPRHSYTIYRNRHSEAEGMSSVEMRDMEPDVDDEEADLTIVSDIANLVLKKPHDKKKALTYLVLIGLFLFLTAFLLGYVAFRSTCQAYSEFKDELPTVASDDPYEAFSTGDEEELYWVDLKRLMQKYLDPAPENIEKIVKRVSSRSHPPGTGEKDLLGMEILDQFSQYRLDHVWTDSHYVTLQFPDRGNPNRLQSIDATTGKQDTLMEDAEAYCAYSGTGSVTGGLVYANYGRMEDFQALLDIGVSIKNHIAIVRVGEINYAEKAANAQSFNAVGLLIYPDPADIPQDPRGLGLPANIPIYGHVHLGTGDPFSPSFPSFNHTQFPPIQSSGLPKILVQPVSADVASRLLSQLSGQDAFRGWKGRLSYTGYRLGPNFTIPGKQLRLTVNNRMIPTMINNIFASIEGKVDPDHYIIIGAQRDSWGPGAAKSGVGTAILLELARCMSEMVQNGFKPLRSLLFASWDAGDFGSVGATEWLEGYLTMLHLKAAAYISVDKAVLGAEKFYTQLSPLLANVVESIIKQVEYPNQSGQSIYTRVSRRDQKWKTNVFKALSLDSSAYAFTSFGGVPAVEFTFADSFRNYPFLNTRLDTYENLNAILQGRLTDVAKTVAEVAGLVALKMAHDYLLPLDYRCYSDVLLQYTSKLSEFYPELESQGLTLQWIYSARGDYHRAAEKLKKAIYNSEEHNERLNRMYNVKIMRVEFYFLSQYVSTIDCPFRHIIHGRGSHTFQALLDHLTLLRSNPQKFNETILRNQLALVTWTLQGAANALSGDVWNIDNNF